MFSLTGILLVSLGVVSAQYGPAPVGAPAAVNPYQNTIVNSISQDTIGNFGYATADGQSRQQVVNPDGSVRGRYSHFDANGKLVTVNYVADKFGYRAAGDNVPAHAQFIPPPQPSTAAPGQWVPPAPQPAPGQWQQPAAQPQPAPGQWQQPAAQPAPTWQQPAAQPAPTQWGQPQAALPAARPAHHHNPQAEQQLAGTIQAHARKDQQAQAAQLQQLDAITRQNPAFNTHAASHAHHYAPSPYFHGRR